ncbi:MAG: FG-GAP repeat protein, partial [Thermoplasmata archaeon]|nr:FG-GAP repeat protein [Thermoplasmata archaeon]
MDTSLNDSDASFLAEFKDDGSGVSVAGAGDVNNDGIDDMLIGAPGADGAQQAMGKAYVIFGKKSGWSMDTNLSTSNASFLGENALAKAGRYVAGGGDLNGDGYDDILISATDFRHPANDTGRTYVVLGKASGWSMDTDLSTADASFKGEEGLDWAGRIDGAGDIDGDGCDDFLIGALGNDEGGISAGQTYLILGRRSGWSKNVSLSNVNASWIGERVEAESGGYVAGGGDYNNDGNPDILIGAINDDEYGTHSGQTYLILSDRIHPSMLDDATPSDATTGDPFTFNVTASDNIGVGNMKIEYWYGRNGSHTNVSAQRVAGTRMNGTWIANITIQSNSTEPLYYLVHIADTSGLGNTSKTRMVTVTDNDVPVFIEDLSQSSATTGDALTLTVNVTDNINITGLWVEYWSGIDGAHMNVSMDHGPGTLWSLTIIAPSDTLEAIHYLFFAEDGAMNFNTTPVTSVNVLDNDLPAYIHDGTDANATTASDHVLEIEVNDNINLVEVRVEYWFEDWPHGNITLTHQSDD